MILVGQTVPDFRFNYLTPEHEFKKNQLFSEYRTQSPCLIFFYPLDFTFVCPSELIALHNAMPEFEKRGIKVLTMSVDSEYSHLAWQKTPPSKGGIGSVAFDMGADVSHHVCQLFGVEHHAAKIALRAAIVIDSHGVVKAELIHDLPIGRQIEEILRIFDAVEHVEKHGEVCPANWQIGKKAMTPTPTGVAEYLSQESK
ncbi:MAG: peroxiredoxin [Gammaproteobacteria bacterium]|nr:peroxiredoxin [Gammaproteobacteria bacterium]